MAIKLDINKTRKPFKINVQGASFTVLPLSRTRDKEITELFSTTEWKNGLEITKVSDEAVIAKAKDVIKDWVGLEGADGKAIPCTPENIEAIMENYPELILQVMAEARNIHAKRVEVAEKN